MKRTLILLTLMAGAALAAPPVDHELRCDAVDGALLGVATVVDDQLHVAFVDGAAQACLDGGGLVIGVADGVQAFTLDEVVLEDGVVVSVVATFGDATTRTADVVRELPDVAVEGMLGAQRHRAEAFARAEAARERAEERRGDRSEGDDEDDEDEASEDDGGEAPPATASGRR